MDNCFPSSAAELLRGRAALLELPAARRGSGSLVGLGLRVLKRWFLLASGVSWAGSGRLLRLASCVSGAGPAPMAHWFARSRCRLRGETARTETRWRGCVFSLSAWLRVRAPLPSSTSACLRVWLLACAAGCAPARCVCQLCALEGVGKNKRKRVGVFAAEKNEPAKKSRPFFWKQSGGQRTKYHP